MSLALPVSSANARLPATYESAKTALAECVSLDECKSWSDKAAALASYAKQASDDELMRMATRIRDRAIRRAGELLTQINGQGVNQHTAPEGSKLTQREAAAAAGMTPKQQVMAVRVARVPQDEFERQVESPNPPTVTELAKQGTKPAPRPIIDLGGRSPADYNFALHFAGDVEDAAKMLAKLDLDRGIPLLDDDQRKRVRTAISIIDRVTDALATKV